MGVVARAVTPVLRSAEVVFRAGTPLFRSGERVFASRAPRRRTGGVVSHFCDVVPALGEQVGAVRKVVSRVDAEVRAVRTAATAIGEAVLSGGPEVGAGLPV
jgi:hypothetical protein